MAVETLKQLKVNLKWKQTTSVLLIYSDNSIAFEKETQMNETLEPGPLNTTKVPQGTLPAHVYCTHNYEIVNDSNTIEPFHNNKRKTSAICLEDWKNVFNFTEYR